MFLAFTAGIFMFKAREPSVATEAKEDEKFAKVYEACKAFAIGRQGDKQMHAQDGRKTACLVFFAQCMASSACQTCAAQGRSRSRKAFDMRNGWDSMPHAFHDSFADQPRHGLLLTNGSHRLLPLWHLCVHELDYTSRGELSVHAAKTRLEPTSHGLRAKPSIA